MKFWKSTTFNVLIGLLGILISSVLHAQDTTFWGMFKKSKKILTVQLREKEIFQAVSKGFTPFVGSSETSEMKVERSGSFDSDLGEAQRSCLP